MESDRLAGAQVKAIYFKLRPMQNYVAQLKLRMEVCQFPPEDPLMVGVERVHQAMMDLTRFVHGLAYRDGDTMVQSRDKTVTEPKAELPAWRASYRMDG